MPALFLTFIAALLAMSGGRSALLVARLSAVLKGGWGLVAVCWISAAASSAIAAWGGTLIAPLMPPAGRLMFAAIALALAALELLFVRVRRLPKEPTHSLGATALVLFADQLTDAARFLVLALAVAAGAPTLAAVGGTLASGTVLTAAWAMRESWDRDVPLRTIRLAAVVLLALAAIVAALVARGIIG